MDDAERVVRERAKDTSKVVLRGHPNDRSDERSIVADDIYRILQEGHVVVPPVLAKGKWKVVVQKAMRGRRDAACVTLLVPEGDLIIVKTVEWIDP